MCCGLARASACHPGPHFVERAKGEDAVAGIDRLERRADESKTKRFLSSCFLRRKSSTNRIGKASQYRLHV